MLDGIISLISWILMLIGCVFIVTGAVGLIRMPDLYSRLHAASITDTGGALFIALALILQSVFVFGSVMAAIKMLLILFFTLITAPTASHALAKAALLSGLIPTDAQGHPLLESEQEATELARSRPADYQSGQDSESYRKEREYFKAELLSTSDRSGERR